MQPLFTGRERSLVVKSPCGLKQSLLRPVTFAKRVQGWPVAGMGVISLKELESHCTVSSTVSYLQHMRDGAVKDVHAQHTASPA